MIADGSVLWLRRNTWNVTVVQTKFVGMMQYDGDLKLPSKFLVPPPAINGTSGELLAKNGVSTFACSETQKFGHVRLHRLAIVGSEVPENCCRRHNYSTTIGLLLRCRTVACGQAFEAGNPGAAQ